MVIVIDSKTYGRKEVLIDDEDYDLVKDYEWCVVKIKNNFYACLRQFR